jgi:murein DD-endopeptidase MepM/ murein hydrolase activator NlpD
MAETKKTERKRLFKKLKNRYRLVLMNDTTFDERFSAYLKPLNVIAVVALVFLVITALTVGIIVLTPLKEYIPGYSDTQTRINAVNAAVKADSLERSQEAYVRYFESIRRVLTGEVEADDYESVAITDGGEIYEKLDFSVSAEDLKLREKVESEEQYALNPGQGFSSESIGLPGVFFFTPIRGVLTSSFDAASEHYGVDIATEDGEAVKAVYDGTIVMASFTSDGGYVIQIQHPNNLISVYKHNSALLKKVGDQVSSGQSIAIAGNTGEFTDGPHLHFELWHNGTPLNPQEFIAFPS